MTSHSLETGATKVSDSASHARDWEVVRPRPFTKGEILTGLTLAAIFTLVIFALPETPIYSGDHGVKIAQVNALVQRGTLWVGSTADPLSVFRPAFAGPFYYQHGENYAAIFPAAYALVVIPTYVAFGSRGLAMPSVAGTLLAMFALARISRLLNVRQPIIVMLVLGLASPLSFYSVILWEHAWSAGLIALTLLLSLQAKPFWSGAACATAVWFRPEAAIFAPVLVLATVITRPPRSALWFAFRFSLGFATTVVPWCLANYCLLGTLVGPQVDANRQLLLERLTSGIDHLMLIVLPIGHKKWLLVISVLVLAAAIQHHRKKSSWVVVQLLWVGVAGIGIVHLLQGQVGVSVTDVFPFGFAAIASLKLVNADPRVRFLWVCTVGSFLLLVLTARFAGDSAWGPRMLLNVFLPWTVLACVGLQSTKNVGRALLVSLLLLSMLVQVMGLLRLSSVQRQWTDLNEQLTSMQPKAVVTAIWWLPQVAAPTIGNMRWYGITEFDDLSMLPSETALFWWIWTDEEPSGQEAHSIQSRPSIPMERFSPILRRKLPTRGLEAVLYEVTDKADSS